MSILLPDSTEELVGRTIMLKDPNRPYQCPGFSLGRNNIIGVVPDPASSPQIKYGLPAIRQALLDGRLVDVTNQHTKGFSLSGSSHTPTRIEDTDAKVYITVGTGGSLAVIAPKDKSEADQMDAQLQEKGILLPTNYKFATRLSEMTEGIVKPGQTAELLHNVAEKFDEIRKKG